MVFLDEGRNAVRDWLAAEAGLSQPSHMIFGTASSTASVTSTSITDVIEAETFLSTDRSVERQVKWEAILGSTDATGSTLTQVAIGTETSGTGGTLFILEDFNDIVKNNSFDLQTFVIAEVA